MLLMKRILQIQIYLDESNINKANDKCWDCGIKNVETKRKKLEKRMKRIHI